jgi:hypothetical protein
MPPRQEPLPVVLIDCAVEFAFVPELPQKVCRWAAPAWPGYTIGSSVLMWVN